MTQAIGYNELAQMLRCAVGQIRDNHEMLSKLDSFGGDGEFGPVRVAWRFGNAKRGAGGEQHEQ